MSRHGRTLKRKLGDIGERRTAWYLLLHGYRVLERNYRFGHKEVDIIARKGNLIAFVEVKSRSDCLQTRPQTAVTAKKQKNIIAAAKAYAKSSGATKHILRFDVAEYDLSTKKLTYIKNAFTDGLY